MTAAIPPGRPPEMREGRGSRPAPLETISTPPRTVVVRPLQSKLGVADVEAESRLVALLLSSLADDVLGKLTPEHFLDSTNRRIFTAWCERPGDHMHVAALTGLSAAQLFAMAQCEPTTMHLMSLVERLGNALTRRRLAAGAAALAESVACGYDAERIAQLLGQLATPAVTSAYPEPTDLTAFMATPPETPAVLIDGLLYRGATMLFAGPSKSRKTFTSVDLGICIAEGREWLGFKTTQSNVLYLNLELAAHSFHGRTNAILHTRGILKPPAGFKVWNLRGHVVNLSRLRKPLVAYCQKHEVGVIFLDPHYKIDAGGAAENSNDEIARLLCEIEGMAHEANAAVVVTHHFAKGDAGAKNFIDRASGAGTFARWPDVFVTMSEHEEADAMSIELALRDFAPVDPFVVRWHYPSWERATDLDPARLKKPSGRGKQYDLDAFVALLNDKPLTTGEWQAAAEERLGMARSSFYNYRPEVEHLVEGAFGKWFPKAQESKKSK